ncbi:MULTISPECIES: hypothetical protein [Cryobacterium]|nr:MULTISPECIES: hypothetical protein [Cryobacterium]
MAPKYRKKPVVIEAMQWTNCDVQGAASTLAWIRSHGGVCTFTPVGRKIIIETLEGPITASLNDFIIKGVQGEFYPCKPDIFAATYEEA